MTDPAATDPGPDTEIDLEAVVREIEADARERRRSGEYPAELERELETIFARFAPPTASGDLDALIDDAEEHGLIEPFIPVESQKPAGRYVKQGFAKVLGWYHTWLTQEISQYAGASVRALRVVADRIEAIERRFGEIEAHAELVAGLRADTADEATRAQVVDRLRGVVDRVLVARGDDGALVAELLAADVGAYGIEPDRARRDAADARGVDLLADATDAHLAAVARDTLAAIVLTGPEVDAQPIGTRLATVDRARSRLAPEGRLLVVAARADAIAPELRELALAPPLSAPAWQRVLEHVGLRVIEVVETATHVVVVAQRPTA